MPADSGLQTSPSSDFLDARQLLNKKLDELRARRDRRSRIYKLYLTFGVVTLVTSPFAYLAFGRSAGVAVLVYGLLFLGMGVAFSPRDINEQVVRGEDELELLAIKDTSREQRAQKLLKLHQSELKRYYDQTLRQSSVIFFAGLVCILLGFAVIGLSLYVIWRTSTSDIHQKLILGGLGAISGILANFVAVMYLRMFTQTISSLAEFHNRLVSTHNLYFGNFLMSKIDLRSDFYEKVLSEIASAVSAHGPHRGPSHAHNAFGSITGDPEKAKHHKTKVKKEKTTHTSPEPEEK